MGGFSLGNFADDSGEGFGGDGCQFGEHFAVDYDAFFLEAAHEFAVGDFTTHCVERTVDADVPEAAKVVLFVAAVSKGILTSMKDCFLCCALFGRASVAVALGHCQDILATFIACFASFYACHIVAS